MKTFLFLRPCWAIGLVFLFSLSVPDFGIVRAQGDPTLSVTDNGTANGNPLWLVEVAPDPSLFSDTPEGMGGSLTVELDIEITDSEFVSVTPNAAMWPNENPGFNPFTSAMSTGVTFDASSAFLALGSDLLTAGDPVAVVTIETLGAGLGTLRWGDYNGNGTVEQADLDLVLLNWGETTPGLEVRCSIQLSYGRVPSLFRDTPGWPRCRETQKSQAMTPGKYQQEVVKICPRAYGRLARKANMPQHRLSRTIAVGSGTAAAPSAVLPQLSSTPSSSDWSIAPLGRSLIHVGGTGADF